MEKVPVSATEAKSTKKQKVSSRGITHLIMVLEIKKDKKIVMAFYTWISFIQEDEIWAGLLRHIECWVEVRQLWPKGWIAPLKWGKMLCPAPQWPCLLCRHMVFRQCTTYVKTAQCRWMELQFFCISSDRCTTVPERCTNAEHCSCYLPYQSLWFPFFFFFFLFCITFNRVSWAA